MLPNRTNQTIHQKSKCPRLPLCQHQKIWILGWMLWFRLLSLPLINLWGRIPILSRSLQGRHRREKPNKRFRRGSLSLLWENKFIRKGRNKFIRILNQPSRRKNNQRKLWRRKRNLRSLFKLSLKKLKNLRLRKRKRKDKKRGRKWKNS